MNARSGNRGSGALRMCCQCAHSVSNLSIYHSDGEAVRVGGTAEPRQHGSKWEACSKPKSGRANDGVPRGRRGVADVLRAPGARALLGKMAAQQCGGHCEPETDDLEPRRDVVSSEHTEHQAQESESERIEVRNGAGEPRCEKPAQHSRGGAENQRACEVVRILEQYLHRSPDLLVRLGRIERGTTEQTDQ